MFRGQNRFPSSDWKQGESKLRRTQRLRTGLYVYRVQLSRCWSYFWAWEQPAILSPKRSVSYIITTLNTTSWTKSMKKMTPNRWTWQVKAQYIVELNTLQRLWPYGECLLCPVLLPAAYCYYHTFLWGEPDWHKTHSTVLRTLYYNKKNIKAHYVGSLVDINRYTTPTLRAYSSMFRLLSMFDLSPQAQEWALTRIGSFICTSRRQ